MLAAEKMPNNRLAMPAAIKIVPSSFSNLKFWIDRPSKERLLKEALKFQ